MFLFLIITAMFLVLLYQRYFPVTGVSCRENDESQLANIDSVLDIRDYNISSSNPVEGALMIPTAYLSRYFHEIPGKKVFVIATDQVEKNVGVRLLRKKGFKVVGYRLTDCV